MISDFTGSFHAQWASNTSWWNNFKESYMTHRYIKANSTDLLAATLLSRRICTTIKKKKRNLELIPKKWSTSTFELIGVLFCTQTLLLHHTFSKSGPLVSPPNSLASVPATFHKRYAFIETNYNRYLFCFFCFRKEASLHRTHKLLWEM